MNSRDWLALVFLSLLWGASFPLVEVVLLGFTPLQAVLLRVGIAAVALNIYLVLRGERLPVSLLQWRRLFVMGFLNNVLPFSLIVWGQTYIESGLASILNATTPLFTVFVARAFIGDAISANKLGGVVLGVIGVAVLIGPAAVAGFGGLGLAQLAVLGAAVSYAFASVYGRVLKDLTPLAAATGMLSASTVIMLPAAFIFEGLDLQSPAAVGWAPWAAVLAYALLSSALAYIIYFRLLTSAGPLNLMLVTLLVPVSAIVLAVVFLDEALTFNTLAGMALIFAGLAFVDGRLLRRFAVS